MYLLPARASDTPDFATEIAFRFPNPAFSVWVKIMVYIFTILYKYYVNNEITWNTGTSERAARAEILWNWPSEKGKELKVDRRTCCPAAARYVSAARANKGEH